MSGPDLSALDSDALVRLPRCPCGAGAVAFAPGTEPEAPVLGLVLDRGEAGRAWCGSCWPWRNVGRQEWTAAE